MYRNSTLIVTAVIAVISLGFQASAQTGTANLIRAGSCSDQELRQAAIRNHRQAPAEAEWNRSELRTADVRFGFDVGRGASRGGNIDECLLSVGRAKDEFQEQPIYSANKE